MQPIGTASNAQALGGHYLRLDMQITKTHFMDADSGFERGGDARWRPTHHPRGLLLPAATLAIAITAALATACGDSASGPKVRRPALLDSAGQVMFGVRAPLTDKGQSKGLLLADSGFVYDDGMRIEFRRVTVTLANSDGAPQSVMTAREASYSLTDSRVDLRGSIEIIGTNGQKLQAPTLSFDIARNRLVGDSAYTLTPARGKPVQGTGFVANSALTRVISAAQQAKLDADSIKAAAARAAKEKAARERAAAAEAKAAKARKPSTL